MNQRRRPSSRQSASSSRRPSQRSAPEPAPQRSSRSSGRSSSASSRTSGRNSSRSERVSSSGGGSGAIGTILIFLIIAGAVGAGGWYYMQGEDHSIRINGYMKSYNSAFSRMEAALSDGSFDDVEKHHKDAGRALSGLSAYVEQHQAEIQNAPPVDDKQAKVDEMLAQVPTLKKIKDLRKIASDYRMRLNTIRRVHDLDKLKSEIQSFKSNPPLDGITMDETARTLFEKQIAFLNDVDKTIDAERARRGTGFKKPTYARENKNELQRRKQRVSYDSLTKNIPYKLEKNKFSDAYKTALSFHKEFPTCDIDSDWEKIEAAEKLFWSKAKQEIEKMMKSGQKAKAQSKLVAFLDNYGNETYGNEARELYAQLER